MCMLILVIYLFCSFFVIRVFLSFFFFFFQAEDGIRDLTVTGVQTCALPISIDTQWHRRSGTSPTCADACPSELTTIEQRETAAAVDRSAASAYPLPESDVDRKSVV